MSSSYNFPPPTTKADDLEDLYRAYMDDRSVVLDLAGMHETPETMREGYYGAYLSFFHSCGLIFPIPEPILEILAEHGLSLTQILPNFHRHLVTFFVKDREEGLSFGLGEFRQLVLEKRNQQNPGPFLVSPCPGRHVIDDIPYRDEKWREQFFVFKMDRASMGEFDFSRLRRRWAENIDVSGERQPPVSLSLGSEDETVAATRKRRRLSEGALPSPSRARFSPEGDGSLFVAQSDLIFLAGRMRSAGCRLPSLASSAEREAYAKLLRGISLLISTSSPVMEAFNEYVVVMEDHVVASRNDKEIESIGSEIKRLSKELKATKREGKKDAEKIEAFTEDWKRVYQENEALTTQMVAQKARIEVLEVERDRDIRRASRVARHDIATRYQEILESLKDKWSIKNNEVSAEIRLQEVAANIDLLNELKDEGLSVDAELARLKDLLLQLPCRIGQSPSSIFLKFQTI
ncbi:uncharacterized protein LOC125595424 [Brassica napus]|uniref:uncharacterized protein LOC106384545 n=1 Tax=Brassica napus TaxID=3708 RepID=UPI0006AAE1FF|nr:uncharacterized protein LOC106384545 [Brassica napus]XP_048626753.1 uncharacterized protein LOC125594712 [Brassica napus]XP_048627172.1 uncharacterized protein LOC125595424 [Brassica napus]